MKRLVDFVLGCALLWAGANAILLAIPLHHWQGDFYIYIGGAILCIAGATHYIEEAFK